MFTNFRKTQKILKFSQVPRNSENYFIKIVAKSDEFEEEEEKKKKKKKKLKKIGLKLLITIMKK